VSDAIKKLISKHKNTMGCYGLFRRGVCVYVGKSTRIGIRISQHLRKIKGVDFVKIWDYTKENCGLSHSESVSLLCFREAQHISLESPQSNKTDPFDGKLDAMDYYLRLPMVCQKKIKIPDVIAG
jgi:hypothetical protein